MAASTAQRRNGNGRPKSRQTVTPDDGPRNAEMVVRTARAVRKANQANRTAATMDEIGTSGLRQYGGFVLEEWLNQLTGRRAAWAYREMMDNSPVVGAILYAIEWLARGVDWRVEPGNDARAAEHVEQCMDDMSHTWQDLISEALSCLPYGWAYHETVYKRRLGPQNDRPVDPTTTAAMLQDTREDDSALASSKYNDGLVGWRKIPGRAQETLLRWHFDGYSGIQAMEQIDWHGGDHIIPIEKALLFRARARRNNPEGFSILRTAYVPYFRLKNIEQIEAIGIERDLAGIPVAKAPENVDIYSATNSQLLQAVKDLVTSIRRDEYEGIVLPTGWELELLSSGGSRQIDTDTIVRRYEQRIATSMLADFVLVGQDSVGSFAMVDVKADLFGMAIDGILDLICEVLNRYAIPRLLELNGMDTSQPPEIRHGSAGRIDLEKVGAFLQAVSLAGGRIPWSEELMKHLFSEAGLPANFEQQARPERDPVESPEVAERLQAARSEQDAARLDAVRKAASLAGHKGAMVALYPDERTAALLAQPGGEPAEELHLTLAYLGDAAEIEDPDRLAQAMAGFAATSQPMVGETSGHGQFTAGPLPVSYASVDAPDLPCARERLVKLLRDAGAPASAEHGFTPHITLSYANTVPSLPASVPLRFDHVTLRLGDERHDFPLRGVTKSDSGSRTVEVAPQLADRARVLSAQLERDMQAALAALGEQAAEAYLAVAEKADAPSKARLVQRVLSALNLGQWVRSKLSPILRNHAGRTMADTKRLLSTEIGVELHVGDDEAQRITAGAGKDLRVADIQPQVRAAIMAAVEEGLAAGENPVKTAARIRQYVPAGRFVHAGSRYRSQLIARNETANLQRASTLAAYRSNPRITAVRLRDGIYGPPRSDGECIARDGDVVPIGEAESVHPNHVLCTLGYEPVVSAVPAREPAEPALAGVA